MQVFYPDGGGLSGKFTRLNAVYWTLAIEFQFYLVVMLALVLRKRFYLTLLATTALSLPFLPYPATRNTGIFLP